MSALRGEHFMHLWADCTSVGKPHSVHHDWGFLRLHQCEWGDKHPKTLFGDGAGASAASSLLSVTDQKMGGYKKPLVRQGADPPRLVLLILNGKTFRKNVVVDTSSSSLATRWSLSFCVKLFRSAKSCRTSSTALAACTTRLASGTKPCCANTCVNGTSFAVSRAGEENSAFTLRVLLQGSCRDVILAAVRKGQGIVTSTILTFDPLQKGTQGVQRVTLTVFQKA